MEESTTLAGLFLRDDLDSLRERASSSSDDILMSGALPGSAHKKQQELEQTKAARLQAYMSISSKSVADTRGWRIRAAYRLVCYMARILGDLVGPNTLDGLFNNPYTSDPSCTPFHKEIKNQVYGTEHIVDWLRAMSGITYLPQQEDLEDLDKWCNAYEDLSIFLRLDKGTIEEPQAGVFGTVGMFNTETARFLWPTRDELLLYEQELLLMVFDALCVSSGQRVEKHVMEKLGYSRPEAVMLVKTGLRYGTTIYQEDFDMNKIRELKSLEVLADLAKDGDDPGAVLAVRKQIQLVSGHTKNEMTQEMDDFRELASRALEDTEEDIKLLDID